MGFTPRDQIQASLSIDLFWFFNLRASVLAGLPQRESAATLDACTVLLQLKRQMLCLFCGANGRADLK